MHPLVGLVRRYCEEYVNRHDFSVLLDIMAPDYQLHVGGFELLSRDDDYIPTMTKAFEEYPEFAITVHELLTDGQSIAIQFSLHSSAANQDAGRAVWCGMVLYGWDGNQLTEAWAEEDFYARKMQLRHGSTAPLQPALADPWSTSALPPDPEAEKVVREWLAIGSLDGAHIILDDVVTPGCEHQVEIDVHDVTVNRAFAVDGRVAFHATHRGSYLGGLADLDQSIGSTFERHIAGIAKVDRDQITSVRAFSDRLELSRRLRNGAASRY